MEPIGCSVKSALAFEERDKRTLYSDTSGRIRFNILGSNVEDPPLSL
jgi:hypothetical protein